jgi:hypothetical protein
MNLQGCIAELQDTLENLYLEIEHRFKENQLIRDLWTAMAHDITQQKRSMSVLPSSFWHQIKEEQAGWPEAISESIRPQADAKQKEMSLRHCFEHALQLEEPTILNVYIPIIRKLRENWTDQALDFYIMVKAHITRITRVTQSFAGDPVIIQRSSLLLQRFEKEVQGPQSTLEHPARKGHTAQAALEKYPSKPKKAAPKAPAMTKHAKTHHSRTKPMVEKINLTRRRAHR